MKRRTFTTGLAWTVPAVTVAGAAPAFAASPSQMLRIQLLDDDPARSGVPSGQHPQWQTYYPIFFAITNLSSESIPAGTVVTWTATVKEVGQGTWRGNGGVAGTTFWREDHSPYYPAGSTFSVPQRQSGSAWPSNFDGNSVVLADGGTYILTVTLPEIPANGTVNVTNGHDKGADPRAGNTVEATNITMAVQITSTPEGVAIAGPSGYSVPNLTAKLDTIKTEIQDLP